MKLVEDWKRVANQAWSIKFAALSLIASLLEVMLPMFTRSIPPGTMAGLAALSGLLSGLSRVFQQQGMRDDPKK